MCCLCTAYLSFSCCCQCVSCYMYAVWQNWITLCDARWINPHCSHELYESVMNWYFEENPSGSFRDVKYLALRNLKAPPDPLMDAVFIVKDLLLLFYSFWQITIYGVTLDVFGHKRCSCACIFHWGSCLMKHIESSHDHKDNYLTF